HWPLEKHEHEQLPQKSGLWGDCKPANARFRRAIPNLLRFSTTDEASSIGIVPLTESAFLYCFGISLSAFAPPTKITPCSSLTKIRFSSSWLMDSSVRTNDKE